MAQWLDYRVRVTISDARMLVGTLEAVNFGGKIQGEVVPRCSMYGVFTYIWVVLGVNVGKYTIH